ncbi:MAG TPA: hypothetical protein PLZ95_09315 [Bryobacteraceae bacterium]|nr:hypothetical protein [Bryobacteraceae bacterium]
MPSVCLDEARRSVIEVTRSRGIAYDVSMRTIAVLLTAAASLFAIDPSVIESRYGRIGTDRRQYRPLDTVRVTVQGRAKGDALCRVKVADPSQRTYFERDVPLTSNRGSTTFQVSGALGTHYVYLWFPGEKRYSRYVNILLDAETSIETGDRDFDSLYPFTREAMRLGRRDYMTPRGRFVGYISGDTWHFDGIWLRDWIYSLPGYKHWEHEMQCGLDRFLEVQREDGQTPDGIERDGRTWRVGLESDVEYILTLGVWDTWRATGDDEWMRRALPKLEKALAYIQSDPKHWDPVNRLIKRQAIRKTKINPERENPTTVIKGAINHFAQDFKVIHHHGQTTTQEWHSMIGTVEI